VAEAATYLSLEQRRDAAGSRRTLPSGRSWRAPVTRAGIFGTVVGSI